MRITSRVGLAIASGLALVVMAPAQPASADNTYVAVTSEEDGRAIFEGYDEILKACDDWWDGEVTTALLFNEDDELVHVLHNEQGAGTCVEDDLRIPDGTTFYLQACNVRWDDEPTNCGEEVKVVA